MFPKTFMTLGFLALASAFPAVAQAGADTTPPNLSTPPYATFVVGQQISNDLWGNALEKLTWKASDPESGISGIEVYEVD